MSGRPRRLDLGGALRVFGASAALVAAGAAAAVLVGQARRQGRRRAADNGLRPRLMVEDVEVPVRPGGSGRKGGR